MITGTTAASYPQLLIYVKQAQRRAEAGDPASQMLYGMLLAGLPQLNRPRTAAMPWFLKSAQAGLPVAQYQVGYSLLKGWGCDCDVNKGLEWLRRAAQAGQPDAEVRLAEYALHGNPDEERLRQAKLWLEQAAASGNRDGRLYLAALLATSDAAEAHDPKRAIQLVDEVFKGVKDDPTAFEIRAAAQASASGQPGLFFATTAASPSCFDSGNSAVKPSERMACATASRSSGECSTVNKRCIRLNCTLYTQGIAESFLRINASSVGQSICAIRKTVRSPPLSGVWGAAVLLSLRECLCSEE